MAHCLAHDRDEPAIRVFWAASTALMLKATQTIAPWLRRTSAKMVCCGRCPRRRLRRGGARGGLLAGGPVEDVGALRILRREHVRPDEGGGRGVPAASHELPVPHRHLQRAPPPPLLSRGVIHPRPPFASQSTTCRGRAPHAHALSQGQRRAQISLDRLVSVGSLSC